MWVLFLYHVGHRGWTPVCSPWLQVALSAAPSCQALYQPLNHSFCFYLWIRFPCQFILPLAHWPCNIVEIILFNSEPSRFPNSCCAKAKALTLSYKTWRDGTLPLPYLSLFSLLAGFPPWALLFLQYDRHTHLNPLACHYLTQTSLWLLFFFLQQLPNASVPFSVRPVLIICSSPPLLAFPSSPPPLILSLSSAALICFVTYLYHPIEIQAPRELG